MESRIMQPCHSGEVDLFSLHVKKPQWHVHSVVILSKCWERDTLLGGAFSHFNTSVIHE